MGTFRRMVTGHSGDGRSDHRERSAGRVRRGPRTWRHRARHTVGLGHGARLSRRRRRAVTSRLVPAGRRRPARRVRAATEQLAEQPRAPTVSNRTLAAAEKLAPGLLSHFDDRNPGMHRSATTDMLYVISGRCVLELDDGSKTEIGAGDVVVQSGTMHRWHNPFAEPCRVLGALVGARWTK